MIQLIQKSLNKFFRGLDNLKYLTKITYTIYINELFKNSKICVHFVVFDTLITNFAYLYINCCPIYLDSIPRRSRSGFMVPPTIRSKEKLRGHHPYSGYLSNKKWHLNEVQSVDL